MCATCRNGWFPASASQDRKNHSYRWPHIVNWGFCGVTHVTLPSRWKCNSWRYFKSMSRIVLILLPVAILSSVFLSCSIESDARGNVLKESEIFLADNFQLENSEDFLRDCLFPGIHSGLAIYTARHHRKGLRKSSWEFGRFAAVDRTLGASKMNKHGSVWHL